MQMVVLIATQKLHSGFSTYRVKSVGKHMGTAGLNQRKRRQQVNTAVSMSYFCPINLGPAWEGKIKSKIDNQITESMKCLVS